MSDPRPELFAFVRNRQWLKACERLEKFPLEGLIQDRYGNSALSLACCRFPPMYFVAKLLECIRSRGEAVVKRLLVTRTTDGWTPLHVACLYANRNVLEALLCLCPEAARTARNASRNQTPLQYLCWFHKYHLQSATALLLDDYGKNIDSLLGKDTQLHDTWEKACLLLRATLQTQKRFKFSRERIVHACASTSECPPVLLKLAITIYPHQVLSLDEVGNLPLHIALRLKLEETASDSKKPNEDADEPEDIMRILLLHSPSAAFRRSGEDDKLPLHLAIAAGLRWNNGLKDLFDANPCAIYEIDRQTKLAPFMLASVGRSSALCSSFELLRKLPQLEVHCQSAT